MGTGFQYAPMFLRGAIAMSLRGSEANEAISGAWGIASLLKGVGNDAREIVARNDKGGGAFIGRAQ